MRVAVTGATGFLGGVVSRRLSELGHTPIALGRDGDKLAALGRRGLETFRADLAELGGAKLSADAVVHCAALSSPWGRLADFHCTNVMGTRSALDFARRASARRFVHISTPSVYFRFRDQIGVQENEPLPKPVNAYARTKGLAEALALAAGDLDPIVLRPRGLYGAGDVALLPRLLETARRRPLPLLNDGRAATDLTHVNDAADAVCAALNVAKPRQRVFNISGGEALNVREVADRVAQRAGLTIRWRVMPLGPVLAFARASEAACALQRGHPEPAITAYGVGLFAFSQTLDIRAACQHLGWRPRIRFDEGLDLAFGSEAA